MTVADPNGSTALHLAVEGHRKHSIEAILTRLKPNVEVVLLYAIIRIYVPDFFVLICFCGFADYKRRRLQAQAVS